MSLSAAVIEVLVAKGMSATDILDIARAAEPQRTSAALRQKRYRDNKRGVTRDVTPAPNERDILTPTRKTSEPKGSSAKRGCRLPENWEPSKSDIEFSKSLGHSDDRIALIAASFGDYWRAQPGQRGVKTDWPATWRNWNRREGVIPAGKPKYVSASGYEYRGDEEAVMKEAQRRGDNQTYWIASSNRKRRTESAGNVASEIVRRAASG